MVINEVESIKYNGGAWGLTASLLSAANSLINTFYSIGRDIGSSIKRIITKTKC